MAEKGTIYKDIDIKLLEENVLGKGSYGVVYKVIDTKTNKVYAVKKVILTNDKDNKIRTSIENEIKILKKLSYSSKCNQYILCIYDTWSDTDNIFILTEFIEGHTLSELMGNVLDMSLDNKACLASMISLAILEIHKNVIAHLDIKPDNIMIHKDGTEFSVKIIDFGFACDETNIKCKILRGTPRYIAPEMIQKGSILTIGQFKKADVYSFGIMLFYIFNKNFPFTASTQQELFEKKLNTEPKKSSLGNENVDNLINSILVKNPDDRPGIDVVYNKLKNICLKK